MRKCFLTNKIIVQVTNRMKSTEMTAKSQKLVYKSIVEGRAVLRLVSKNVFYNPVQEFNRDLSIAVLNVFTEDYKKQKLLEAEKKNNDHDQLEDNRVDITILEALSATGLRSIRYAKEIVNATRIIANDISEQAVVTMRDNIAFNNVDHIVETSHEDAALLMYKHKRRSNQFAAVDLDPYGSPTPFLDAAVQSVADGGLLLVTATDMAVLAGNVPETCYSKYGAISIRTKCCHEMALRILLQCIEAHANRYGRYIVPMLSVSADFYIRVFVKIYSGAGQCKKTTSKLSMVYHCVGCHTITLQPLGGFRPNPTVKKPDQMKAYLPTVPPVGEFCDHCNQRHQLGGPIWSAAIHDEAFVTRVLCLVQDAPSMFGTAKRLEGMLSVVREELCDAPLYYTLDRLCGTVHCEMIPMLLLRSAIMNAGYKVSYSHANKQSIKTKAPSKLMWDIIRTWVARQTVKPTKAEADPVAKYILSREVTFKVDLTVRDDANPDSRKEKQTRFQFNPAPHWGPGCKSTINDAENKIWKSRLNQNKKKSYTKYQKRRLHSPDGEGTFKRTHRQQLLIDTTSEVDSDTGTEPAECDVVLGAAVTDAVDRDAVIDTVETEVENGTAQPDGDTNTSKIPCDVKQ